MLTNQVWDSETLLKALYNLGSISQMYESRANLIASILPKTEVNEVQKIIIESFEEIHGIDDIEFVANW